MTPKQRAENYMRLKEGYQKNKHWFFEEKIADELIIRFAEWMSKYKFLKNKGWYQNLFDVEMDIFKTSKELLEIYKKENNL